MNYNFAVSSESEMSDFEHKCHFKYKYTKNWFLGSEIRRHLLKHMDATPERAHRILEIGCFEGLSSVFFSDYLLKAPNARMVCVDPFMRIADNDHRDLLQNDQEQMFDDNIAASDNAGKIRVFKTTSDEYFERHHQGETFDFIYIDGSHECENIRRDMANSFAALESGGIMWMDDYRGGDGIKIRNTMDTFLREHQGEWTLIHSGYQLAIRKN